MLGTKEFYELITMFEREYTKNCNNAQFDKTDKEIWNAGTIYKDSTVNMVFRMFMTGYAYGKIY